TAISAGSNPTGITTGAAGTINVANFNLLQGGWQQITASLPSFAVSNNFQLNSGSLSASATVKFVRAFSGDGSSGTPYMLADVYGLQGIGANTTSQTNYY